MTERVTIKSIEKGATVPCEETTRLPGKADRSRVAQPTFNLWFTGNFDLRKTDVMTVTSTPMRINGW